MSSYWINYLSLLSFLPYTCKAANYLCCSCLLKFEYRRDFTSNSALPLWPHKDCTEVLKCSVPSPIPLLNGIHTWRISSLKTQRLSDTLLSASRKQSKEQEWPKASHAMGCCGRLWSQLLTQLTHPSSPKGQPQAALTQKRLPHSGDEEEHEEQEAWQTPGQSSPYFSAQPNFPRKLQAPSQAKTSFWNADKHSCWNTSMKEGGVISPFLSRAIENWKAVCSLKKSRISQSFSYSSGVD